MFSPESCHPLLSSCLSQTEVSGAFNFELLQGQNGIFYSSPKPNTASGMWSVLITWTDLSRGSYRAPWCWLELDWKTNLVGILERGKFGNCRCIRCLYKLFDTFHFEEKYSAVCYILWACWNIPLCLLWNLQCNIFLSSVIHIYVVECSREELYIPENCLIT